MTPFTALLGEAVRLQYHYGMHCGTGGSLGKWEDGGNQYFINIRTIFYHCFNSCIGKRVCINFSEVLAFEWAGI